MGLSCECPKCGQDISDSYMEYDPSVGSMSAGWYCVDCDVGVADEGPDPDIDLP
jgi:hypothetical protein